MKRTALGLAALVLCGAAAAQSVTLFGAIDVALQYTDNGGARSVTSLSQDGNTNSRLGLRGVEDLGGGLRAGFWLEGAFGPDTGCGGNTLGSPATCTGLTWQRRSTLSLIGRAGELRLGRDYTPTFFNLSESSPFGYNGIGSPSATVSTLASGATTAVRANNALVYFLPPMGGVFGHFMVAAGEGSTGNKYAGARVGYRGGPVTVGVAVGHTYRTGTMADAFKVRSVGGSYGFGALTLQGYFGKYAYLDRRERHALVGLQMPVGAGTIRASFIHADGKLGPGGRSLRADQLAVGYVHDLSKRTALYGTLAQLSNRGAGATGALFTVGNGATEGFVGGQASRGLQLGARHLF